MLICGSVGVGVKPPKPPGTLSAESVLVFAPWFEGRIARDLSNAYLIGARGSTRQF